MTRDQVAIASITLVTGGLLLLPPFALLVFRLLRARAPRALRGAVTGCCFFVAVILGATLAGVRLDVPVAGCALVMTAYGAYCFLVAATNLMPSGVLRLFACTLGLFPILAGFLAATLGWLGLAWVTIDLASPSESSEQVAPGMTCETMSWGSVASASGYARHLYRDWPLGLRRQVAVFTVAETEPADPNISCAEAFERYRGAAQR